MRYELFVARRGRQLWAASREDGCTVELRVASVGGPEVGRIVKARVSNVVTGIQSAFLDLGTKRDGFLHARDLLLPGEQAAPPFDPTRAPGDGRNDEASGNPSRPPIQDRLKPGRELVVQITRGALGSKGARVSSYLTLAGRLLVLFPQLRLRSVSRKIAESPERERLQEIVDALPGEEIGFVARTAARGALEEDLRADADELLERWWRIRDRIETAPTPSVLAPEPNLLIQLLRDAPPCGYRRVVVDRLEDHASAAEFLHDNAPADGLPTALEHHTSPVPLFEAHGLDREIEKALRPRVWLKSGGYIVIEQTEALVSIDVNTGKNVRRKNMEDTVLRTNLEAADEIARQLRLRDLGGIIVIDFVDMGQAASRSAVLERLDSALERDAARTHVVGLSELGLVQLTRKRTRPDPGALLTRICPTCAGHGRVKGPGLVAGAALSEVRRLVESGEARGIELRASHEVVDALREADPDSSVVTVVDDAVAPDRYELRFVPD
jgi:ribonuclease G